MVAHWERRSICPRVWGGTASLAPNSLYAAIVLITMTCGREPYRPADELLDLFIEEFLDETQSSSASPKLSGIPVVTGPGPGTEPI